MCLRSRALSYFLILQSSDDLPRQARDENTQRTLTQSAAVSSAIFEYSVYCDYARAYMPTYGPHILFSIAECLMMRIGDGFTPLESLIFGALISATDPVTVLAICLSGSRLFESSTNWVATALRRCAHLRHRPGDGACNLRDPGGGPVSPNTTHCWFCSELVLESGRFTKTDSGETGGGKVLQVLRVVLFYP